MTFELSSARSGHGQNHAKACLSRHHLRVGIRRLVEWDGLGEAKKGTLRILGAI